MRHELKRRNLSDICLCPIMKMGNLVLGLFGGRNEERKKKNITDGRELCDEEKSQGDKKGQVNRLRKSQ